MEKELNFENKNGVSDTWDLFDSIAQNFWQRLILPVNKTLLGVGFKAACYPKFTYDTFKNKPRLTHYGHDYRLCEGWDYTIWASGNGRVIVTGDDSICGKVVIIRYENVLGSNGIEYSALIFRYFHLAEINVKKGQLVTKDTKLGVMGNTGVFSTGTHLHLEIDTEVDERWACYSPTVSSSGKIIKSGTDTMINPGEILYVKTSTPDNQKYLLDTETHYKGMEWFNEVDRVFVKIV